MDAPIRYFYSKTDGIYLNREDLVGFISQFSGSSVLNEMNRTMIRIIQGMPLPNFGMGDLSSHCSLCGKITIKYNYRDDQKGFQLCLKDIIKTANDIRFGFMAKFGGEYNEDICDVFTKYTEEYVAFLEGLNKTCLDTIDNGGEYFNNYTEGFKKKIRPSNN